MEIKTDQGSSKGTLARKDHQKDAKIVAVWMFFGFPFCGNSIKNTIEDSLTDHSKSMEMMPKGSENGADIYAKTH